MPKVLSPKFFVSILVTLFVLGITSILSVVVYSKLKAMPEPEFQAPPMLSPQRYPSRMDETISEFRKEDIKRSIVSVLEKGPDFIGKVKRLKDMVGGRIPDWMSKFKDNEYVSKFIESLDFIDDPGNVNELADFIKFIVELIL